MERPDLAAVVVDILASASLFFFFKFLNTGNVIADFMNNLLVNIWQAFHPLFQISLLCGWVSETYDSVVEVIGSVMWGKLFVTFHSGPLWLFHWAFCRYEIHRGLIVAWRSHVLHVAYQFGCSNAYTTKITEEKGVGLVRVLQLSSPEG